MSQKKSLHDLTNGLIQNGMEDYDSCVMLAVKGEKAVFACSFQGDEDHISPSCVRLAMALHDLLKGELKKADAIASALEAMNEMYVEDRRVISGNNPDLDDMTKDMLDAIIRNTFGGDKK